MCVAHITLKNNILPVICFVYRMVKVLAVIEEQMRADVMIPVLVFWLFQSTVRNDKAVSIRHTLSSPRRDYTTVAFHRVDKIDYWRHGMLYYNLRGYYIDIMF